MNLVQVALPWLMKEDRVEGNRNGTDPVVKMAILYSNLNSFVTVCTSNHITFLVCQPCGPRSQCVTATLAFMMFWIPNTDQLVCWYLYWGFFVLFFLNFFSAVHI